MSIGLTGRVNATDCGFAGRYLGGVERYLDRVAGISTAEYEAAYARAVAYMHEGLLLHIDREIAQ